MKKYTILLLFIALGCMAVLGSCRSTKSRPTVVPHAKPQAFILTFYSRHDYRVYIDNPALSPAQNLARCTTQGHRVAGDDAAVDYVISRTSPHDVGPSYVINARGRNCLLLLMVYPQAQEKIPTRRQREYIRLGRGQLSSSPSTRG